MLGTDLDLGKVDTDTYVVAGIADHLCKWESCYQTTQLLGGDTKFVLSTSGHIAAMVNPPGNPKASFQTATQQPGRPAGVAGVGVEGQGQLVGRLRRLAGRAHAARSATSRAASARPPTSRSATPRAPMSLTAEPRPAPHRRGARRRRAGLGPPGPGPLRRRAAAAAVQRHRRQPRGAAAAGRRARPRPRRGPLRRARGRRLPLPPFPYPIAALSSWVTALMASSGTASSTCSGCPGAAGWPSSSRCSPAAGSAAWCWSPPAPAR